MTSLQPPIYDCSTSSIYSCIHCINMQTNNVNEPNVRDQAMHDLNDLIMTYYVNYLPSKQENNTIKQLQQFIVDCTQEILSYEEYKTNVDTDTYNIATVFGSVGFDMQSKYSDIDIAVNLPQFTTTFIHSNKIQQEQRKYAQKFLTHLSQIMKRKYGGHTSLWNQTASNLKIEKILNAKVPIIKITDTNSNAQGDISLANFYTKHTVTLMKMFTCFDDYRIKPFIMFIKIWSKQRGINNAYKGYLNSFGFTLLAIKYFQYVTPSILPIYEFSIDFEEISILKVSQNKENKMNLGELLYGFFYFYVHEFDVNRDEISILSQGLNYKHLAQFTGHLDQKYFILQDPVQFNKNVAKNVRCHQWNHIKNELIRSLNILANYNFELESDFSSEFRLLTQDCVVLSYSDYNLNQQSPKMVNTCHIGSIKDMNDSQIKVINKIDFCSNCNENLALTNIEGMETCEFCNITYYYCSEDCQSNHLKKHRMKCNGNNNLNEQITNLFDTLKNSNHSKVAVNQLFKINCNEFENYEESYILLKEKWLSKNIICEICMEEFAKNNKVYVAQKDEWILKNACYVDGSNDSTNLNIVHRKCYQLKNQQCSTELNPILVSNENIEETNMLVDEIIHQDGNNNMENKNGDGTGSFSDLASLSSMSSISSLSSNSSNYSSQNKRKSRSRQREIERDKSRSLSICSSTSWSRSRSRSR